MKRFFDFVLAVDSSGAIVVLKVLPGTARAVALAVDAAGCPDVLGSVAGNDTVFVIARLPEAVETIIAQLDAWV